MLTLPTRNGWTVMWYTGEVRPRTRKMKDGTRRVIGEIRMMDSFESVSREEVERKAEEIKAAGYEIRMITECVF